MNLSNITETLEEKIEKKRTLTREEFDEGLQKGLIEVGDIVKVYNEGKIPEITEYRIIPYDRWWRDDVEMLQRNNWQSRNLLVNMCKEREDFWAYMKEKNIIPNDIITKDILYEIEQEAKYGQCWRGYLGLDII